MKRCLFHDVGHGRQDRKLFEIVGHAYNQREKVLIYAQNEERAASLDRTLWILKQESFIPHRILRENDGDVSVPVAIVAAEINPIESGILIHKILSWIKTLDDLQFINEENYLPFGAFHLFQNGF